MCARSPLVLAAALLLLGCGRIHALVSVDPAWAPNPTGTAMASAPAGSINPNNILVSIGNAVAGSAVQFNSVREFTPAGSLVQTIPFNYNNGSYPATEYLRDIVVDRDGSIAGYN